jgi:hypothetical protein
VLRWPALILVCVNAVALGACVVRLLEGSRAQTILAQEPLPMQPPEPVHETVAPLVDLAVIQSAAVFYEARSFYTPPVVPAVQPPPDYRLAGTLVLPGRAAVAMLVQGSSGARRNVREGEELDGWTVTSIQRQLVKLRHAEQEFELRPATHASAMGIQRMPLSGAAQVTPPASRGIRMLGNPR